MTHSIASGHPISPKSNPALVIANWGGLGLHLRGTIRGYMGIASREKWLKVQSGSYFHTFLQPQNAAMQKRFFDRYLKGIDNGWENEPRVEVEIRAHGDTVKRVARSTAWPFPETQWTRFFLDAANKTLGPCRPNNLASATYPALSEGVTFSTAPWAQDVEIVGPVKAKLFVSSSTQDMDIFATVCAFDPQGREMTFIAAPEPKSPVTQGWLRVSQRKLDPSDPPNTSPITLMRSASRSRRARSTRLTSKSGRWVSRCPTDRA